ncbi:MAG: isoprenylcysteine carboxylmethyltransferase family protein [Pirellulales bacterium]
MSGGNTASPTALIHAQSAIGRIASLLTRKRALVTTLAVLALLAAEYLGGHRPRDIGAWHDPSTMLALACVGLGLGLRTWAAGTLHKSTVLTTRGPYRWIRNPLYAGSFWLTAGFCALLGGGPHLLLVLIPISWLYVLKVRKEERSLANSHGAAWAAYAGSTPRFIPRSLPRLDLADWRATLWTRNHEYRACLATVAGLVALKLWHDL